MPKIKTNEDSDYVNSRYCRKKKQRSMDHKSQNHPILKIKNSGKWNLVQKKLYVEFLQLKLKEIRDSNYRKQKRIFKQMSQFVKTRTSDQCRSHHQKMLKFHFNVENIVTTYRQKIFKLLPRDQVKAQEQLEGPIMVKQEKPTKSILSESFYRHIIGKQLLQIIIDQQKIEQY